MSDEDQGFSDIGGVVGAAIIVPLIVLTLAAYGALFYLPLWRWFVVPLGAPDMGFWHFVGLRLFWTACCTHYPHLKPGVEQPIQWQMIQRQMLRSIALPPLILVVGAIIHFWLM